MATQLQLDPRQREAVEYDGSPLLIVAGPDSGKTRVLVYRVAYMITTLKKAAEERRLFYTVLLLHLTTIGGWLPTEPSPFLFEAEGGAAEWRK